MINAARPAPASDMATTIRNLTSVLEDMHSTVDGWLATAQQRDRDWMQQLDE